MEGREGQRRAAENLQTISISSKCAMHLQSRICHSKSSSIYPETFSPTLPSLSTTTSLTNYDLPFNKSHRPKSISVQFPLNIFQAFSDRLWMDTTHFSDQSNSTHKTGRMDGRQRKMQSFSPKYVPRDTFCIFRPVLFFQSVFSTDMSMAFWVFSSSCFLRFSFQRYIQAKQAGGLGFSLRGRDLERASGWCFFVFAYDGWWTFLLSGKQIEWWVCLLLLDFSSLLACLLDPLLVDVKVQAGICLP